MGNELTDPEVKSGVLLDEEEAVPVLLIFKGS